MKIGRVVSVLVWTLLLAPSFLSGQEACGPPGPLRIRDMTPPAVLTLGFMPSSASLMPYSVALSRGISPVELGLAREGDVAYVQCLDPCERTGGGTVVFAVKQEAKEKG